VRAAPELLGAIAEALKGPWRLSIAYRGAVDTEPRERLVEPHGLLLGTRRYLVARPAEGDGIMRHYRLDRIDTARLEPGSFARDPDFDLAAHAARAFGSFHAEDEYAEVVWRFSPAAAPTAREFVFHPEQEMTEEPDGALTIRFHASGWLEMAWHLYMWGDAVEVLAPEALREMVEGYRREDFPALP
jgi:predicted DNA-binding transcriptional regulator YafY